MRIRLSYIFSIFICVSIFCFNLFYGSNMDAKKNSQNSELKIKGLEFKKQNTATSTDICIIYPQIEDNQNPKRCLEINDILYKKFMIDFKEGLSYQSDYEIKTFNSNIISVLKKGEAYVKGSLYPMRFLDTINISLPQLSLLEFDNTMIGEKLILAEQNGCIILVDGVNDLLDLYSYKELVKMFLEQSNNEKHLYFINQDIGFIVYLNHVGGDYVILETTCEIMK